MREKLEEIKKNALDVLQKATDIDALEEARIKFLGKKGELTAVLKGMGQLSKEERPQILSLIHICASSLIFPIVLILLICF